MLADIYVSQPMNETFYSSISDQSTGLRPTSWDCNIDDDDDEV